MKGSFCVQEGLPRDRNRWWSGVCCSCSLCRRRYLFDAAGWGNWVRAGAGFTYLVRTLKTLWSSARSAPKFLVGAAILDRPDDATFALHPFTLHRPPRSPAFFFCRASGGSNRASRFVCSVATSPCLWPFRMFRSVHQRPEPGLKWHELTLRQTPETFIGGNLHGKREQWE